MAAAEADLYEMLLEQPGLTVPEAAERAAVTVAQARRMMQSLEEKGLVSRSTSKPPRHFPAPPDTAIEVLILHRREELERARLAAGRLLAKFHQGAMPRNQLELVEVVSGRDAFAQRYLQMKRSVTSEWMAFDKPPYVTMPSDCVDAEMEVLRREGVRYRVIYDREALDRPGQLTSLREGLAAGEQARAFTQLPMKLAVADRRLGFIPLRLEEPRTAALILHESPLLSAVALLFETIWERASPITLANNNTPTVVADASDEISTADRDLVALLALGLQDQTVARQLGVGVRTVERRIKRLLETLDATTRFEAAVKAVARGWVNASAGEHP